MRSSLPVDLASVRLLGALQGAPLSCLVALYLVHPQPVGRSDLAMMTAYGVATITRAMDKLVNVYHLAARIGRYESWCLTDQGVQLRLPFFGRLFQQIDPRAPREDSILALEASSSSGLSIPSNLDPDLKTTTTTNGESSKIALPERAVAVIDEWLDGCPKSLAERAFGKALERGDPLPLIEYRTIAWTFYTRSEQGKSIKARAIFVARKLEQGERCPDLFSKMNVDDRYRHRELLQRLGALQDELDALDDEDPPDES